MISIALFPCVFTDGARIVGELSYTLEKPVYTDQMILDMMSEQQGISVTELQDRLFTRTHKASRLSLEKEKLIECARHFLDQIQSEATDYLYYGFFTSLIDASTAFTQRILIIADHHCRIKRAQRQEHLPESKAITAIHDHDIKAACWTRFLHDRPPYHADLFDTVIRYECQDLFDVITYICMKYDAHLYEHPQLC
jgi:hypothetical protein